VKDNNIHMLTTGLDYIKQIAGKISYTDELLVDQLIGQLNESSSDHLPEQDFELFVNQLYNTSRFGPITELELFLTENCNLRCEYCFVKDKRPQSMPLDKARAAINFLVFYSAQKEDLNITFFGGEPLLEAEKVIDLIEFCESIERASDSKKRFSLSMTTNGTLVNEEILKQLKGKLNLLLSIDGDKETHNKYRKYANGNGSFEHIMSNIALIKKYQPWLGTRMTILPDTVPNLYQNVRFLFNSGINQFIFGLAPDSDWDKNSLGTLENELEKIIHYYLEKKSQGEHLRLTLFEKNEEDIKGSKDLWGCRAGRHTIAVNTKGDIYPCSKFLGYEEYDCPEIRLGSIFEGITNIDFRRKMTEMKSDSYIHCSKCPEIDSCFGGCPAVSYYENRNIYHPCSSECALTEVQNRVVKRYLEKIKTPAEAIDTKSE
jgi:uncharacterized protein